MGELGTRVAELEKIRNFLTGQALTTILDGIFRDLYRGNGDLQLGAHLDCSFGSADSNRPDCLGAPLFRRQYRAAAEENAKTQSHLVEVLTGIQTVKAQNVEMVSRGVGRVLLQIHRP